LVFDGKHLVGKFHHDNISGSSDIGDIRICYFQVPCGPISLVSQQVQDRDYFTFRQWNPKKELLPYGQNNDADYEAVCPGCPCTGIIDKCF